MLVAGALGAALAWPSSVLVVANEDGRTLWQIRVREGERVILAYTNSIYVAPTRERFEIARGRLRLIEVSSTREAVLEYNRLPPPYRVHGGRVTALVVGVTLDELLLRVGATGRPTLTVGGTLLPLYEAGVGSRVRITIKRMARLATITARPF